METFEAECVYRFMTVGDALLVDTSSSREQTMTL